MANSVQSSTSNETSMYRRNVTTALRILREPWTDITEPIFSRAVICILCTQVFLTLTFWAINENLVLFGIPKILGPETASILDYAFPGTTCLVALIGGWLADSKLGKLSAILYSIVVNLMGTILLLIASMLNNHDEKSDLAAYSATTNILFQKVFYITGLFLVAFGTGGLAANVPPLGADQLSFHHDLRSTQTFFRWFYWFTNAGLLLVFIFVVCIQQYEQYLVGNIIPPCSLILALLIFRAGRQTYIRTTPCGSVSPANLKIFIQAIKKSLRPSASHPLLNHWLDRAKTFFGGSYSCWEVEDLKSVYRLLPIFGTLFLYWTVYYQMLSSMIYQGQHMSIPFGSNFKISIPSLPVLELLLVFVLLPIMDKIIYPLLEKLNISPSQLQRIGVGMLIAAASSICAGGIEWFSVDHCCIFQDRSHKNLTEVSSISIFYQVPQYFLLALSEIFTYITSIELAYTEAPQCFQGITMGIFFVTGGLGKFATKALVLVVNAISGASDSSNKWSPEEDHIIKGHHLSYYFFLLAGLISLIFILYVFVAISFKKKKELARQADAEITAIQNANNRRDRRRGRRQRDLVG